MLKDNLKLQKLRRESKLSVIYLRVTKEQKEALRVVANENMTTVSFYLRKVIESLCEGGIKLKVTNDRRKKK